MSIPVARGILEHLAAVIKGKRIVQVAEVDSKAAAMAGAAFEEFAELGSITAEAYRTRTVAKVAARIEMLTSTTEESMD